MYDIENALRRRAMAERLEALNRAAEAVASASDVPETPIGPRHRAQPAGSARTVPEYARRFVGDDTPLAREAALAAHEPVRRTVADERAETLIDLTDPPTVRETGTVPLPPAQPSAPVTPTTPFPTRPATSGAQPSPYSTGSISGLGGQPITSSPYVAPSIGADERATAPAAVGGGTTLDELLRPDTVLSLRAPDQTARLEVTSFRTDTTAPPPLRGEPEASVPSVVVPSVAVPSVAIPSVAIPSGVTLLLGPLGLHADEPPPASVAVAPNGPLAPGTALVTLAAPAAVEPVTPVDTAPTVADAAVPVDTVPVVGDAAPADDVPADVTAEPETDDAALAGSSAATIADLLRHGGSRRLFFDR